MKVTQDSGVSLWWFIKLFTVHLVLMSSHQLLTGLFIQVLSWLLSADATGRGPLLWGYRENGPTAAGGCITRNDLFRVLCLRESIEVHALMMEHFTPTAMETDDKSRYANLGPGPPRLCKYLGILAHYKEKKPGSFHLTLRAYKSMIVALRLAVLLIVISMQKA